MNYEWITDEMFDRKLNEFLRDDLTDDNYRIKDNILSALSNISTDIYAILTECYNNEIIIKLEEERLEQEDENE